MTEAVAGNAAPISGGNEGGTPGARSPSLPNATVIEGGNGGGTSGPVDNVKANIIESGFQVDVGAQNLRLDANGNLPLQAAQMLNDLRQQIRDTEDRGQQEKLYTK